MKIRKMMKMIDVCEVLIPREVSKGFVRTFPLLFDMIDVWNLKARFKTKEDIMTNTDYSYGEKYKFYFIFHSKYHKSLFMPDCFIGAEVDIVDELKIDLIGRTKINNIPLEDREHEPIWRIKMQEVLDMYK